MTKTFEYIFWTIITIALFGITLAMGISIGSLPMIAAAVQDPHPLKTTLDSYGLNLLGDTLSGVFAPATFLIVVITAYWQNRQTKQNIAEMANTVKLMKDQVDIAEEQLAIQWASTDANWKLSLFDKRMKIYMELQQICLEMGDKGKVDPNLLTRLSAVGNEIRFVFGPDVQLWIKGVLGKVENALKIRSEWSRLFTSQGMPDRTEDDEIAMSEADLLFRHKEREIDAALDWDIVKENLDKHIMFPHRIEPLRYRQTR